MSNTWELLDELEVLITDSPPKKTERRKPPSVGTKIQRSDAQNARKRLALATPPPSLRAGGQPPPVSAAASIRAAPRAPRRVIRPAVLPTTATVRRADTQGEPATAPTYGPAPPPPIMVEYEPGQFAPIPYFSATISRKYKLRDKDGRRWKLRFDHRGQLTSSHPLPSTSATPPGRKGEM
jgi:hypothetical protein